MEMPTERSRRTSRAFQRLFSGGKRSVLKRGGGPTTITTKVKAKDDRHDEPDKIYRRNMGPIMEEEEDEDEDEEERQSPASPSFHVVPNHAGGGIELSIASFMGELDACQDDDDNNIISRETYTVEYYDEQSSSAIEEAYIPRVDRNVLKESDSVYVTHYLVGHSTTIHQQQQDENASHAGSRTNHQADHWRRSASYNSNNNNNNNNNNKLDEAYIDALNHAFQPPSFAVNASIISRLTSQASESICSISESGSYDYTESTPVLPDMLLLQTHSDGTKELISFVPTQSCVSKISEQEENDEESYEDEEGGSSESGNDDDDDDDDEEEEEEEEEDTHDNDDSGADGSETVETQQHIMKAVPMDDESSSNDDYTMDDSYTCEDTCEDGYESAFTDDDGNEVPFLEPIEPPNKAHKIDNDSLPDDIEEEDEKVRSKNWLW